MDGKEIEDVNDSAERESQCCIKCSGWEERFIELKLEFERKMSGIQNKLSELVGENRVIRSKVESLKPEDGRILELMIENQVLERAKKKAESDVQVWKSKCEELERRVMELERAMPSSSTGMAEIGLGVSQLGREETNAGDTFRNVIPLREEGIDNRGKKIDPAAPADVGPASRGVIGIDDRDVSEDLNVSLNLSDKDDAALHKRKRASNVIASDSESDPGDHLFISSLKTKSTNDDEGKPVIRRRRARLRNSRASRASEESPPSHLKSIKTDKSTDDEDESESEGGSLDGFIVNDSYTSDAEFTSKDAPLSTSDPLSQGDSVGKFGDDSDADANYGNIIARIGRREDRKWNWGFQAEMQAAFGKDPELCMRAVCALYRKQTSFEKFCKATFDRNNEGFSNSDAFGGSELGEFLTAGDPEGDLRKSVEELNRYDPTGVEKCRKLALHYSNQLFRSYQSREDPLWLPSESK